MKHRISWLLILIVCSLSACDSATRNGYMLHPDLGKDYGIAENPLFNRGFDWWWHSFVAKNRQTGEMQPFFIEYYVINPGLGGDEPILGQAPESRVRGLRPSYAMIKAGSWKKNAAVQIHNFYGINQFQAARDFMEVRIADNFANETELRGSVKLSEEEARNRPEFMSQSGTMSWDLKIEKILAYSLGYAASEPLTVLNSFKMWWHIPGMKALYTGTVSYNGEIFDVLADESYGYQDKNWGTDYTNPWVWLNCNNFISRKTGFKLPLTSLDVGGGQPEAFGIPLGKKVLVVFYHEGKLYEFNFSKIWQLSTQSFDVKVTDDSVRWQITAQTPTSKIEIDFSNPRDHMLKVNYENPDGQWLHRNLYNGGHASGTVKLFEKTLKGWSLIDTFDGSFGGSEYGIHP